MKLLLFIIISLLFVACQSENKSVQSESKVSVIETIDTLTTQKKETIKEPIKQTSPITVMIVPCSNGYEYAQRLGDLNPSLEKYIAKDKRIHLEPFPYNKMKGSGFHGVYDKHYCKQILETVSVDFLIMSEMSGGIGMPHLDSIKPKWGYATKVLNTKTMNQFKAISAKELDSYYDIDGDIQSKTNQLIKLIIESAEKK